MNSGENLPPPGHCPLVRPRVLEPHPPQKIAGLHPGQAEVGQVTHTWRRGRGHVLALPCTLSAVSLRGEEGNLTQTDGRGQGSSQRAGSQGAPLTTTGTCGVPRGPCGEAAGPGSRNPDLHHHPRLLPASPRPRDGGWAGCVPGAQSHSDQGEGAQQDRRGVTNSNTSRGDFGSSRFGGAVYASVLAQRWRWLQGPPSDTVRAEMTGWGQPVPGFGGGD